MWHVTAVAAVLAACVVGAFAPAPAGAALAGIEQVSLGTAGNGTHDAFPVGVSDDGSAVLFSTSEQLAVSDTDAARDLYARSGGQTVHVTDGDGALGNSGVTVSPGTRVSADGRRAFFATTEKLTADDADANETDIYMRDLVDATTTLVSKPANPNADSAEAVALDAISSDGGRVFFNTQEGLAASDTDGGAGNDIYVRDIPAATTTQVTPPGSGGFSATFAGATADGSRAFFVTQENLPPDSDGGFVDLYRHDLASGTITLISQGDPSLNTGFNVLSLAVAFSADGGRAFFATGEQLTSADTDLARTDVYLREGAATTQVSLGTAGGNGAFDSPSTGLLVSSADGRRLVFYTAERLEATDTDNQNDLYLWDNGAMRQISLGNLDDASTLPDSVQMTPDGQRVFFRTSESLEPADTDASADLYAWQNNNLTRLSLGSAGGNAAVDVDQGSSVSIDGGRLFFRTRETLEPTDGDGDRYDIYLRERDVTTQVSQGGNGPFDVTNAFASKDGGALVFETREQLASTDLDSFNDVYVGRIANPAPEPTEPTTDPETCRGKIATMVGTEGNDRIKGTKRQDVIVGLGGRDRVNAGKGNDTVCAGNGNDIVSGKAGNDRLFGEDGRDRLTGGDGRDLTNGGPGRDACNGGPSRDRARGCERGSG
jgi:Tol biopolymer transport system component